MIEREDVAGIVCPTCRVALTWRGRARNARLDEGSLDCAGCGIAWPVVEGLARLHRESEVRGNDRLLRTLYDRLPSLHDPLTTVLTPLLQATTERRIRDGYLRRLELGALPEDARRPLRILETGIGAGANLPLLERDLPPGLPVEIWGLDLSAGMLALCRRRLDRDPPNTHRRVRLLLGDAHALPFPGGSFDRVFHVGGIGGFRDPGRALAEMARVARPGTPIVVVDEQLDPARRHGPLRRALFRLLTFYDPAPHAPRAELPPGATRVIEEQLSPFYYCLTFRMPSDIIAA